MKVLIINGSPRLNGNTAQVAQIIEGHIKRDDIDVEIYDLGDKEIKNCTACMSCFKTANLKCIIDDDLNELVLKAKDADAIILGSPVHFASISGLMKNAMDRLFYVSGANGNLFRNKIGASYTVVRRSGGSVAFQTLNNYLTYCEMVIPGSNYWTIVHGWHPGEAQYDAEGLNMIEVVSKRVVQLLDSKVSEKLAQHEPIAKVRTNFVREDLM